MNNNVLNKIILHRKIDILGAQSKKKYFIINYIGTYLITY